jgi:hypothetical protein
MYGVLPKGTNCLAACRACYNLHRTAARPLPELPERLLQISRQAGLVDLDKGLPDLTDEELKKVPAFIRTSRSGRGEILFTQTSRDRFFPDFEECKRQGIAACLFKSEKKRNTVRRRIRLRNKKDVLYRFFLTNE